SPSRLSVTPPYSSDTLPAREGTLRLNQQRLQRQRERYLGQRRIGVVLDRVDAAVDLDHGAAAGGGNEEGDQRGVAAEPVDLEDVVEGGVVEGGAQRRGVRRAHRRLIGDLLLHHVVAVDVQRNAGRGHRRQDEELGRRCGRRRRRHGDGDAHRAVRPAGG